ncbi:YcaO-like family protein [Streptomyces marincola]|uniref:YcaO-like family protein n=1 Tax=Streptomyces marincola TaxID=2878388 RepID=UPI001CF3874F|nr:YcaO-like family protein [Streptomyces marincola]UCM88673.1 YcaO-like family protein [Streptomyces marincola]
MAGPHLVTPLAAQATGPLGTTGFRHRLAPWVVTATRGAGTFVLGPRLSLARIAPGAHDRDEVPVARSIARSMGLDRAVASGWLEPVAPTAPPPPEPPDEPPDEPVTGILVHSDPATAHACTALAERLTAQGAGRWVALAAGQPPPATERPPFVVVAAHRRDAARDAVPPVRDGRVLHVGEAFEGTYITGPGRGTAPGSDTGDGFAARWAFETRLASLGLTDRPVPLLFRIREDPAAVVRAIMTAMALPPSGAVLVATGRTVRFCTPDAVGSTPLRDVPRTQAWTFGMARGFGVGPGSVPGSYIATCRTPAGGQDHLEGNSGKGPTEEAATTGAVGEALERYAAYEANWSLPPSRGPARRIDLADLHPYGDAWERRVAAGAAAGPPVAFVDGAGLADGAAVAVPRALVAFPYVGADRPTDGTTTGLAAGPDLAAASLRGLREVLERHSLYGSFAHLRPGYRLDPAASLDRLGLTGAFKGEVWAVHWPHEGYVLPDVHAFHHDPEEGLLVRASGSGLTFDEAMDSALAELCQVHFEGVRARRAGAPAGPAHAAWARRPVVGRARRYLDALPAAAAPPVPYTDPRAQFDHLVSRLADRGTGPVVVRLPLRGPDWTVVRVLVPGATTATAPSDSRGGRRLADAPWTHGIPT